MDILFTMTYLMSSKYLWKMSSFEFYHHAVFDYLHFTLRTLFFSLFKDFCPLTFALLSETRFT